MSLKTPYVKTKWVNDSAPYLTAENLNNMDEFVKSLSDNIDYLIHDSFQQGMQTYAYTYDSHSARFDDYYTRFFGNNTETYGALTENNTFETRSLYPWNTICSKLDDLAYAIAHKDPAALAGTLSPLPPSPRPFPGGIYDVLYWRAV